MKKIFNYGIVFAAGILLQVTSLQADDAAPSAEQIINKAIEKSRQSEAKLAAEQYTFTKVTETEKIDDKGRCKERKKTLHEMFLKFGCLIKKRVAPPGETVAQAKKTEVEENSEPLKLGKVKATTRGDYINILTPELIGKYVFTLVDRLSINGRPAFVVAFQPKQKDLPGKELAEKVMNQAKGKLWIDAEEFELAKAQVHVDSEIPVGGGLLGSLKRAAFLLERTRLANGVWFDRSTKTDYEARKLTESTRVITRSESSNFQKLSSEG